MKMRPEEKQAAERLIRLDLREDCVKQDITTKLFVGSHIHAKALVRSKEKGVIAGSAIAKDAFLFVNRAVKVKTHKKDGKTIARDEVVMTITGPLASILPGERVALNFLGKLSGVASLTRKYYEKTKPYRVELMDTRKTTPGLRALEKYAVRCGGGINHRHSLEEVAFIKDNHWRYMDHKHWLRARDRLRRLRKHLIVEAQNERQLKHAMELKPNVILFDNLSPKVIQRYCKKVKGHRLRPRPLLEASGGINLDNIKSYAAAGIDRISVGALTHSALTHDFTLEIL